MIGRSIGNYRIVRSLGAGSMGTVYLAEHPKIGKQVAIKMLHRELCNNAEQVSRFFQEARAVNEIGHPNIVDISDFGETDDGVVYFIMELLSGQTLRELLTAGGTFLIERAAGIARQVADAIGAAHRHGIVHRDLKPENIFLVRSDGAGGEWEERVKLFDFGLAKLVGPVSHQAHKTAVGSVLGSPFYMAPEQILSKPVDARADIYALGGVLYEMLTSRVPFHAAQLVELLAAVVKDVPAPLTQHRTGMPPALSQFVLKCLEKDPAARPQTMAEFTSGLDTAIKSTWATGATIMAKAGEGEMAAARWSAPAARVSASTAAVKVGGVARCQGQALPAKLADLIETFQGWPRATRWGIAGGGAALVAGILVAIWVAVGSGESEPAASGPQPEAEIILESTPSGARVVRVNDGTILGNTPTRDTRPADGRRVEYVFRRPGYVDAHLPFHVAFAGRFPVNVTLIEQEQVPPSVMPTVSAEPAATRPAPAKRGKRVAARPPRPRSQPAAAKPIAAPVVDAPRRAASSPPEEPRQLIRRTGSYEQMPPLLPSVRVKRLGRH